MDSFHSSLTSEPGRASVGEVIYHVVFFTICSLAAKVCESCDAKSVF